MVDFDPSNQNTVTATRLVQAGGKPTIAELKIAIAASAVTAKYPAKLMFSATKNDLIYICRQEGIAVAGLPGA